MSAESGLSTFRDADGLWENYPVSRVATHEAWEADPDYVNDFYNMLRGKLVDAKPNRGHELVAEGGRPVTATRIRGLLSEGRAREAADLLGRPYELSGLVRPGRGEGRDFGFATANLEVPPMLLAVGEGVYACYAVVEGARYKAAVNVGVPATFADTAKENIEVHLLDFNENIYGQDIEVEFIEWLRPMRAFESTDELIATVQSNIAWVRENL